MNRNYDEILFPAKVLLGMGVVVAVVPNALKGNSLPFSFHIALGIYGITFGIFSFSLMLLPWWLLQKGVIREGLFSRRTLFAGFIVYELVVVLPLLSMLTLFWFTPTLFLFALQIAEHNVQWNASLVLCLVVLFVGYLLSGLNMYCYIKEHHGF